MAAFCIRSFRLLFLLALTVGLPYSVKGQDWQTLYEESEVLREEVLTDLGECNALNRSIRQRLDSCSAYVEKYVLLPAVLPRPSPQPAPDDGNLVSTDEGNEESTNDGGAAAGAGNGKEAGKNRPPPPPLPCDCAAKLATANDLEKYLRDSEKRCRDLEKDLRDQLKNANRRWRLRYDSLYAVVLRTRDTLTHARDELDEALALLDCVANATTRSVRLRSEAQPALDSARARYKLYESDKRLQRRLVGDRAAVDRRIDEHIAFIDDIYSRYDDRPDSVRCGNLTIRNEIKFTSAKDHINMANILVANPRRLVNIPRFGTSTDQRVALVTAEIIYHVSQIYTRQTDYNERSSANRTVSRDLLKLFNLLPGSLIATGNVDLSKDSTAIDREYSKTTYASIVTDFEDGFYVSALGKYNWLSRFELDTNLVTDTLTRAQVHLAVGTILLFDLGDVSQLQAVTLPGTWLNTALTNDRVVGNLQNRGAVMLSDLIQSDSGQKEPVMEVQREAAYRLSKRYRR